MFGHLLTSDGGKYQLQYPLPFFAFNFELLIMSSSIDWGAGLRYSRLVQGKGLNPLKVFLKENKMIYQKYRSAKFELVPYGHLIFMSWFCGVVVITCASHAQGPRSEPKISDSLPGLLMLYVF